MCSGCVFCVCVLSQDTPRPWEVFTLLSNPNIDRREMCEQEAETEEEEETATKHDEV